MPENQTWAGFLLNAEELEFGADVTMIATLGFFEAMKIFVQFFFGEEARGVNALELRIAFLPFPVGTSDAHQLESLDALGRRNVRAAAEVDELAGGVEGNDRLYGFFFDEFALEDLI